VRRWTLLLAAVCRVSLCIGPLCIESLSIASLCGGLTATAATFSVPESDLPQPLVFVAYGDMRFTDAQETEATSPGARRALVAKVAAEEPEAVFINGDVPYHGLTEDYTVFHNETVAWRLQHTRVYPALGNHEFAVCQTAACLDRWWAAFPELHGRRWYSVALGARVLAVILDSTSSLLPDSEQQAWLEAEMRALDPAVRVVMIVIHHPPLADVQTVKLVDHNPRPNEQALAAYLERIAAHSPARFVVSAGHIHNYERLKRGGVTYLVSGGGGAHPAAIDRTSADLYQGTDFPNYHYVRFEVGERKLTATMVRLEDSAAEKPSQWKVRDRFAISLPP
jgi:acid phosphatase type 7